MMRCIAPCVFIAAMIGVGCRPAAEPPASTVDTTSDETLSDGIWFEDVQPSSGIDFVHDSGHDGESYFTPEIMSGGVAILDIDEDGWMDVYCVQSGDVREYPSNAGRNRLYRNTGDGTFEDVTAGSGADDPGFGLGVAIGDYDADGDVDLYVANLGRNTLLRNDGDGTFTDVTEHAGVGDTGFGSSVAFVDVDHDGDLDLVVCNYLAWSVDTEIDCLSPFGEPDYCAPSVYGSPSYDTLYRNEGDGTFTDVSDAAGFRTATGTGLGVVAGDFNGDGAVDLFIANDGMDDHLWINAGDGTFTEEALRRGCATDLSGKAKAGMGVTVADIDRDDDLDILVCNLRRETDSLFENMDGLFHDVTANRGLAATSRGYTRFGLGFVDFDNDGHLDLFAANGRVSQERDSMSKDDPFAEPNLLFAGQPSGRFETVEPLGGVRDTTERTSRAAAFGDLDNDGGMDIVVINRDAPVHVLRNVARSRGHWLLVRVLDANGSDVIGATVWFERDGDRVRRDVRSAYSYCAANDLRVHFGLGASAMGGTLEVRWVDGTRERFTVDAVDRTLTVQRGNRTIVAE